MHKRMLQIFTLNTAYTMPHWVSMHNWCPRNMGQDTKLNSMEKLNSMGKFKGEFNILLNIMHKSILRQHLKVHLMCKTLLRADNLSIMVELDQVLLDTGQYMSELGLVQMEELFELLVIEYQLPHQSVVGPKLLTTLEEFVNPPPLSASPSSTPRFDLVVA